MTDQGKAIECPDCKRPRNEAGCHGWMDCMNYMRDQLASTRSDLTTAVEKALEAEQRAETHLAELRLMYEAFQGSGHAPKNPREAAQAIGQLKDDGALEAQGRVEELSQRLARVAELAHDRNDDSHEWRSRRLGQCAGLTFNALAAFKEKDGIDRGVVKWAPLAKQLADSERRVEELGRELTIYDGAISAFDAWLGERATFFVQNPQVNRTFLDVAAKLIHTLRTVKVKPTPEPGEPVGGKVVPSETAGEAAQLVARLEANPELLDKVFGVFERAARQKVTELQSALTRAQLDACRMHYLGGLVRTRSSDEQAELNALMRKYPPQVQPPGDSPDESNRLSSAWKEVARRNAAAFRDAHRELDETQAVLTRAEGRVRDLESALCKRCLHNVSKHTDGCPTGESYWLGRLREEQDSRAQPPLANSVVADEATTGEGKNSGQQQGRAVEDNRSLPAPQGSYRGAAAPGNPQGRPAGNATTPHDVPDRNRDVGPAAGRACTCYDDGVGPVTPPDCPSHGTKRREDGNLVELPDCSEPGCGMYARVAGLCFAHQQQKERDRALSSVAEDIEANSARTARPSPLTGEEGKPERQSVGQLIDDELEARGGMTPALAEGLAATFGTSTDLWLNFALANELAGKASEEGKAERVRTLGQRARYALTDWQLSKDRGDLNDVLVLLTEAVQALESRAAKEGSGGR